MTIRWGYRIISTSFTGVVWRQRWFGISWGSRFVGFMSAEPVLAE